MFKRKGFTLIELLIVVGITLVMVGVFLTSQTNNAAARDADAAAQQISAELRSLQNAAVAGEMIDGKNACAFELNTVALTSYTISYYDCSTVPVLIKSLPAVKLKNASVNSIDVTFRSPRGEISSAVTLTVTSTKSAAAKSYVAINSTGSVEIAANMSGIACSSVTYSSWGACQNDGTQTRTITASAPVGCTIANPILLQACIPICTSWTYSPWSPTVCQLAPLNFQNRTITSSTPSGCAGGTPGALSQTCTPKICSSWTYSAWGICQANSTKTRTTLTSSPSGCVGGSPTLSQACIPTCSSFTYSSWGACKFGNTQTRTVASSSPAGCSGGSPVTSQYCLFDPCGGVTSASSNGITYGTISGPDGRCWLNRNLGATNVATAYNDSNAYGWLFQWGRGSDGHQITTSGTAVGPVTSSSPGGGTFLTVSGGLLNWYSGSNPDNLWQGVNGTNNPCPLGFRVPTASEWSTIVSAAGITNIATAANSVLHLSAAGLRSYGNGTLYSQGSIGYYWSSWSASTDAFGLFLSSGSAYPGGVGERAYGMSVRCLKN